MKTSYKNKYRMHGTIRIYAENRKKKIEVEEKHVRFLQLPATRRKIHTLRMT